MNRKLKELQAAVTKSFKSELLSVRYKYIQALLSSVIQRSEPPDD